MHIITQHYRSSSSQAHRVFTTGRRFFKMAAALHPIILFKGMTSDNKNPGGTGDAIEHAGNAEWGYSCYNIPEIATTMRHGAVFFSNNSNLTLMNTDVRRIVSMIKPFSDAKNLKLPQLFTSLPSIPKMPIQPLFRLVISLGYLLKKYRFVLKAICRNLFSKRETLKVSSGLKECI